MHPVDVEVLVTPDCPCEGAAVLLVRRALNDVGLSRVPIRTRLVKTNGEAQRLRFVGSPTVRIDGQDPFADRRLPVGLGCRVYVTDSGRAEVPDLRRLRQALKRHAAAGA